MSKAQSSVTNDARRAMDAIPEFYEGATATDSPSRKHEIATLALEALTAVRAAAGTRAHSYGCQCGGVDERYQKYSCAQTWALVGEAIVALTDDEAQRSPPGEGWQQRIAAMVEEAFGAGVEWGGTRAKWEGAKAMAERFIAECGQHAKDALPPSSSPAKDQSKDIAAWADGAYSTGSTSLPMPDPCPLCGQSTSVPEVENVFEALADHTEAMSDEEIIAECIERGEDPAVVAEQTRRLLLQTVDRLKAKDILGGPDVEDALHPVSEASPVDTPEKHTETCAGHDGLRYCDCGIDQRKYPGGYTRGGPEPDYIKAEADDSPVKETR